MKTVFRTLGLAPLHVRDMLGRDNNRTNGRSHRMASDDEELLANCVEHMLSCQADTAEPMPWQTANARKGAARVNAKRISHMMTGGGLLLP